MKGLLVFDCHSDIAFLDLDDTLNTKLRKNAVDASLLSKLDEESSKILDTNIVLQQLVPLINSQRSLQSNIGCYFRSIQCNDGLLFCLDQVEENTLVAISGDTDENEQFLQRKLAVLKRMIAFLFGPVFDEIKPSKLSVRDDRWKLIRGLINIWSSLYKEDHCFLVEALEYLSLSPRLTTEWTEVLDQAVSVFSSKIDTPVLHALLFVETKILSTFNSRHAEALETGDILLLLVLVSYLYPTSKAVVPGISTGETSSSGSDQFYDSFTEQPPTDAIPVNAEIRGTDSEKFDQSTIKKHNYKTDKSKSASLPPRSPSSPIEVLKKTAWSARKGSSARTRASSCSSDPGSAVLATSYRHFSVMLRTQYCDALPHLVHCIKIMDGVSLVMTTEVQNARISQNIHKLLDLLHSVWPSEDSSGQSPKMITEALEVNVKKLSTSLKKLKGRGLEFEKMAISLNKSWDTIKKNGIVNYLDQKPKKIPAPLLENSMTNMKNLLHQVFRELYLNTSSKSSPLLVDAADASADILGVKLKDHYDYLRVKAARNVTLNIYIEDFPGLVHFLFVDRNTDKISAPTISLTSMDQQIFDARIIVKEKLWGILTWIQEQLEDGTTCITARDDDFFYTYMVNFDLKVGVSIRQNSFRGVRSQAKPGNINGKFYKQMMKEIYPKVPENALGCYEMLCIHNGQTNTKSATEQCKALAIKLKETLRPASKATPSISLL